jgi:hypothetical protein
VREHANANLKETNRRYRQEYHYFEASRLSALLAQGDVCQSELYALLALPTVDGNLASRVHNATAIFHERFAKRLTGRPESNRVDEFPVA